MFGGTAFEHRRRRHSDLDELLPEKRTDCAGRPQTTDSQWECDHIGRLLPASKVHRVGQDAYLHVQGVPTVPEYHFRFILHSHRHNLKQLCEINSGNGRYLCGVPGGVAAEHSLTEEEPVVSVRTLAADTVYDTKIKHEDCWILEGGYRVLR